jgi:peptidoglycan/xylan/chitin deacetylase (PgdA/CDA1 family)
LLNSLDSALSEICHLLKYSIIKPNRRLTSAKLVFSIDIDAGSPKLGILNKGRNDSNVNNHLSESAVGTIEQIGLPIFLALFETTGIPVTFGIRGQLAEADSNAIDCLLNSSVKHEIGAHGYSHKRFTDLTTKEALHEVLSTSEALTDIGVSPKSFIFPRNFINHLEALEKCGYTSYRGKVGLLNDSLGVKTSGSLLEQATTMALSRNTNLSVAKQVLDILVSKKSIAHFWFHLWNFGKNEKEFKKNIAFSLKPLLLYAKQKESSGLLTFDTMLSVHNFLSRV